MIKFIYTLAMALYMKKRKGDRVDPQQQMSSPLTHDWAMKKPPPPTGHYHTHQSHPFFQYL